MPYTLIIVEDERLVALDIKRRLSQMGHTVVAVCDRPQTALEAISQFHPDLVLMDIRLKGNTDGVAIAAHIREQFNIPVTFLTAHADEATLNQAKAAQPYGYLVKPVETENLNTTIEVALVRHQADNATRVALATEKELNALRARFISIVSHEFLNPLSTIQLTLEALDQSDPDLSPEYKKTYIQQGKNAIRHMRELLDEVLVVGEGNAGKLQCHPTPLNLPWFCRELVDEMANQAVHHQIVLTMTGVDERNEAFYNLDPKLIRYIVTHLLSNAIKYSPQGGDIHFDLICRSDIVLLIIQDFGMGIPPSDRTRLFEAFHRGTNVDLIPGTGLGLAITKQCVDAHQGKISVDSVLGKGTTITVTLPATLCEHTIE